MRRPSACCSYSVRSAQGRAVQLVLTNLAARGTREEPTNPVEKSLMMFVATADGAKPKSARVGANRPTRRACEAPRALRLLGEHCASAASRCCRVLAAWANVPNPLVILYAKVQTAHRLSRKATRSRRRTDGRSSMTAHSHTASRPCRCGCECTSVH